MRSRICFMFSSKKFIYIFIYETKLEEVTVKGELQWEQCPQQLCYTPDQCSSAPQRAALTLHCQRPGLSGSFRKEQVFRKGLTNWCFSVMPLVKQRQLSSSDSKTKRWEQSWAGSVLSRGGASPREQGTTRRAASSINNSINQRITARSSVLGSTPIPNQPWIHWENHQNRPAVRCGSWFWLAKSPTWTSTFKNHQ